MASGGGAPLVVATKLEFLVAAVESGRAGAMEPMVIMALAAVAAAAPGAVFPYLERLGPKVSASTDSSFAGLLGNCGRAPQVGGLPRGRKGLLERPTPHAHACHAPRPTPTLATNRADAIVCVGARVGAEGRGGAGGGADAGGTARVPRAVPARAA